MRSWNERPSRLPVELVDVRLQHPTIPPVLTVALEPTPRVTFNGTRISGNASCNNFNGSFRFQRGRLTTGPLASTRMACSQRVQNVQESNVLRILGETLSVSRNRNGKLVLTGARRTKLVLAPASRR